MPKDILVEHPAYEYISLWHHLSLLDDEPKTLILLDVNRIEVPKPAQALILSRLHTSHQGIVKTRLCAQNDFFRPGMLSDVKNMIEACEVCQKLYPSITKEHLSSRDPALFPMQEASTDLFDYGGVVQI